MICECANLLLAGIDLVDLSLMACSREIYLLFIYLFFTIKWAIVKACCICRNGIYSA